MNPAIVPSATRRSALKQLFAATSLLVIPRTTPGPIALGNRAHFTARPAVKERLLWCFSSILECGGPVMLNAPGLAEPIAAFQFTGGGSISIEFTDGAPDEHDARRGAWLEIQTDDADRLVTRVLDAGLRRVEYAATTTFYFAVPGGQVFGIVDPRRLRSEIRQSDGTRP